MHRSSLSSLDTLVESDDTKERWLDSGLGSEAGDEEADHSAVDKLLEKELETPQDLEAQSPLPSTVHKASAGSVDAEYRVPTRTKLAYLAVYFLLNLILTIYNKAVLGKVRGGIKSLRNGSGVWCRALLT